MLYNKNSEPKYPYSIKLNGVRIFYFKNCVITALYDFKKIFYNVLQFDIVMCYNRVNLLKRYAIKLIKGITEIRYKIMLKGDKHMKKIYRKITDLIGHTPLLRLGNFERDNSLEA